MSEELSPSFLARMPDGTVKQLNPFTRTEAWTVPGRGNRPIAGPRPEPIEPKDPEDYCIFCAPSRMKVSPEKACMSAGGGIRHHLLAGDLQGDLSMFRRVSNLFEIISYDYWEKNYGFVMPENCAAWKDAYLSTKEGYGHVMALIDGKLKMSGLSPEDIAGVSEAEKLKMAGFFFAGGHELIIGPRHYMKGARQTNQKASSGTFTPEEHDLYMAFTIEAMRDIYLSNRYVRYVTVFQNWLAPAGASLDHLHKQLVALDCLSTAFQREMDEARTNPNIYNAYTINFASYHNLIFAENNYAVAYADYGHRYPTLAVYSKSAKNQPWNLSEAERRGMSDLIHACHAAMGPEIPCNEEWHYRPPDSDVYMPWRVLIKWRVNNPAGFESVTKIYINTIDPWTLRDRVVPKLFELREKKRIASSIKIAAECSCAPNALMYNPHLSDAGSQQGPSLTGRGHTMNY